MDLVYALVMGSPPRVRSRRSWTGVPGPRAGIISACAEQTQAPPPLRAGCWDHLRVCGADDVRAEPFAQPQGSPPRVRSRRRAEGGAHRRGGITSACAEQTRWTRRTTAAATDHLRVCGADAGVLLFELVHAGSPPRVRSRLVGLALAVGLRGITSACAEQTTVVNNITYNVTDHLRVCGADTVATTLAMMVGGSPPRVRSRQDLRDRRRETLGITSACAEQTKEWYRAMTGPWDHLRVCGADTVRRGVRAWCRGSPPRVRSRHLSGGDGWACAGITSACAEQTKTGGTAITPNRDHLRVCGADKGAFAETLSRDGSPPRVRSRP